MIEFSFMKHQYFNIDFSRWVFFFSYFCTQQVTKHINELANVENCKSQIERDSAKIHFAQSAKLPSTGKCENYMNEIMATV